MSTENQPRASSSSPSTKSLLTISEPPLPQSPLETFDFRSVASTDPVICIDNGSYSWRGGFSSMSTPYIDKLNQIARYKERKQGRNIVLFGRDTEADANARSNARQMFDGDMLIHGDLLECALDYTFSTLGIDTSRVNHPVVMTERLANPLFTRAMTSELLFELYGCPAVTYGVDSLFAFSRQKHRDGLAISLGHNATTITPVVDGRGVLSRAKRLPWGGAQASELMLKLAQLKYPNFPVKVTQSQATFMYRETCYFATDYDAELKELEDPAKMREKTVVLQFPYTAAEVAEKSEAELAAALERRREQGKRLQEMQARQRSEKLAEKVAELDTYKSLVALRPTLPRPEFLTRLYEETPFETEAELESWIKRSEAEIRRKQRKMAGEAEEPEEEPTFPLVDVPDEELDDEGVKEKRRQRLMKAGWEARVKIREEKRLAREKEAERQRMEEEERATDLSGWASRLRAEQNAVIERMEERKKRRSQMRNRKSAAAQARMKTIANLAADSPAPKKRKKGEDDDGFGRDDSDWAVYREVGGDDESEAEEDDSTLLSTIESRLLQYDPTFSEANTLEGRKHAKNALINAFVRGGLAPEERFDAEDIQQNHQLHLNVERIRVPEVWFQPGICGVDSAGLGEVAGWVMGGLDDEVKRRVMQCIFVTGGSSKLPNLLPRLRASLTPLLPFRAPLKIVSSLDGGDPALEAWKGMAEWSGTDEARQTRVTRQMYEECGGEYLLEHAWGNVKP